MFRYLFKTFFKYIYIYIESKTRDKNFKAII